MFNSYSLLNLILRFFREGRRRIRISRLWSIYILLRVSEQKKKLKGSNWVYLRRQVSNLKINLKFGDGDGPNSVACQFHIYWKYISVWVDPSSVLEIVSVAKIKNKSNFIIKVWALLTKITDPRFRYF